MRRKAALASVRLALLFLVVYGGSNYLASLRPHVGSIHFTWERRIPLVPIFIVPYMSIDLFFLAAPFLCRDEEELRALSMRLGSAIIICGACFVLFPLRFGFERPAVAGPLGVVLNHFRTIDRPFNQCPSLHVALCLMLAFHYTRHSRGAARSLLAAWFVLIGVSVLLTYQHHVIDVAGGLIVGALCWLVSQDGPLRQPGRGNSRVGSYYLVGCLAACGAAVAIRGVACLLLWPALSLGLVAAGYFGEGAGIYRKRNGRIGFTARLLLWPVLLGQRASLAWYARRSAAWNALTDSLWIGRTLNAAEAHEAIAHGVTAVLDLTCEFSEAPPFLAVSYRQLPVLDLTAPTPDQIEEALVFIQQASGSGAVYVHCKAGYSRTAAIAGAYLLSTRRVDSVDQAVARLRSARPGMVVRHEALRALREFSGRSNQGRPQVAMPPL